MTSACKIISLICFSLVATAAIQAQASPVYLHLSGQITSVSQDQLLSDLSNDFETPMSHLSPPAEFYVNDQSDGSGYFYYNFIAEPTSPQSVSAFNKIITRLQAQGFFGLTVRFQPVVRIFEQVEMDFGIHNLKGSADNFQQNFSMTQSYAISTVTDWEKFTDHLGDAFLSHSSRDFLSYLQWFSGDPDIFASLESQVLTHDNVVIAHLQPYIILKDNSVIDPDQGASPFFDIPFSRNCWDTSFEGGNCYDSKSSPDSFALRIGNQHSISTVQSRFGH